MFNAVEYNKKYREAHREQAREYAKKYNREHRAEMLEYFKKYYIKNKKQIDERNLKYHYANRDIKIQYFRKHRLRLKMLIFDAITPQGQKPACAQCGCNDVELLQFHHINGGGELQRREHGTTGVWSYYAKHPEQARQDIQILCYMHHKRHHSGNPV